MVNKLSGSNNSTSYAVPSTEDFSEFKQNVDDFFMVLCGLIVLFIHLGLTCMEAGRVRSKNVTNVFFKNFSNLFICGLVYWLIGYALAFSPGNCFMGLRWWADIGIPQDNIPSWFYQYLVAAIPATILCGAVAERCNPIASFSYTVLISGITYPVVVHWISTDEGWLKNLGYVDVSGTGTVFAFSGITCFVAAFVMGPRKGRFTENSEAPSMHSVPLLGTGAIITVIGLLAFNCGGLGHISQNGDGLLLGKVLRNTVMGGVGGCLVLLTIGRVRFTTQPFWPFSYTVNGCLSGMVAISACGQNYMMWESFVVGIVAAMFYVLLYYILLQFQVDDPLDGFPVFFGGGFWGAVASKIFTETGIIKSPANIQVNTWVQWIFLWLGFWFPVYEDFCINQDLLINITGVVTICAWGAVWIAVLFLALKFMGKLRVEEEDELQGLDKSLHKEEAYYMEAHPYAVCEKPSANKNDTYSNYINALRMGQFDANVYENMGIETDYDSSPKIFL